MKYFDMKANYRFFHTVMISQNFLLNAIFINILLKNCVPSNRKKSSRALELPRETRACLGFINTDRIRYPKENVTINTVLF